MIRITDYKEKYKQLVKENDDVYLIRWDYEDDKEIDPETRIESETPLGTWTYERLYYTPSIDAIQNMILSSDEDYNILKSMLDEDLRTVESLLPSGYEYEMNKAKEYKKK